MIWGIIITVIVLLTIWGIASQKSCGDYDFGTPIFQLIIFMAGVIGVLVTLLVRGCVT